MKQIMLLAVVTAIHYSALGDYLVDQNGNRTEIKGSPHMVCYEGRSVIRGNFLKAKGATIWLQVIEDGDMARLVKISKPVCDLK